MAKRKNDPNNCLSGKRASSRPQQVRKGTAPANVIKDGLLTYKVGVQQQSCVMDPASLYLVNTVMADNGRK